MAIALTACSSDGSQESSTTGGTTSTTSTGSNGGAGGTGATSSNSAGGAGGATSSVSSGGGGSGGATSSASSGGGGSGGNGGSGGGGGFDDIDNDGDGWSVNEGDCCDVPGICADPKLVNPGAFEFLGNGVDDDCDPATPDDVPPADCSPAPLLTPTSAADLVSALDLCQWTTENAPKSQRKWGVISAALTLADGTGMPADVQTGVLAKYGANVVPKKGPTMAALSTGTARGLGDPGYVPPQDGKKPGQDGSFSAQTLAIPPGEFLIPNGGIPKPAQCPSGSPGLDPTVYDSAALKLRIRVPTNAFSFTWSLRFFSAEFPERICQKHNDFFVALLDSQSPMLPADGNVAFDTQGNPVSIDNAFMEVCFPPVGAPAGACPLGSQDLFETGMGGWDGAFDDGGGTEWLKNDGYVVPGETIELRFMIWDEGDHEGDSLVLLDRFRWNPLGPIICDPVPCK